MTDYIEEAVQKADCGNGSGVMMDLTEFRTTLLTIQQKAHEEGWAKGVKAAQSGWTIEHLKVKKDAVKKAREETVAYISNNLMWGRTEKGDLVISSKHLSELFEAARTLTK